MLDNTIGKKAEKKVQQWLDRPEEGYCLDRQKDQMTGFYGSKNICDFTLFKSPTMSYIESKSTWEDNFPFAMIAGFNDPNDATSQYGGMLSKSKIVNVYGIVIALFATHQRAFILKVNDIAEYVASTGKKSLNIKKISSWAIPYIEIQTIPNNRKELLDYTGEWPL